MLAAASITEITSTHLRALQADLRGRLGADRAQDGGRLVPGQELEVAGKGGSGVLAGDTQCQFRSAAEIVKGSVNEIVMFS